MQEGGTNRDIFCMVKMNMSDTNVCQKPLLVLPQYLLPETENFFNRMNTTESVVTPVYDPERAEELMQMAEAIGRDFPHMSRSVAFYRSLLAANRQREGFPAIQFITAPKAAFRWQEIQLGERPPPPKPHCLQVVFHR